MHDCNNGTKVDKIQKEAVCKQKTFALLPSSEQYRNSLITGSNFRRDIKP